MVTDIFILGLLAARPLSGYDIQQYIELSAAEHWAEVLPGSIYYALNKLERQGFVAVESVERTGRRERATYRLTLSGHDELRGLLHKALRTPERVVPALLYTALTFIHELEREDVLEAFDVEIIRLEQTLAYAAQGEAAKVAAPGTPPFMAAIFANSRAHVEADLALLKHLRANWPEQIRKPELPSRAELRAHARAAGAKPSSSQESSS